MAWHPFRNVWLKVAALVLGTLLWFTVSGQQVERKVPGVQVSYRNVPSSLQITDQVDTVNVFVRGVESQITALQPGELVVEVDLRGAREGSRNLPLGTHLVNAPLGVEVTQIEPGMVPITLEAVGAAEIPVEPQFEGEPAPGYVITGITVEPRRVTALGPARRLDTARALTDRVAVAGAKSDVTARAAVGIADAQLRLPQPVTATITVHIDRTGTRRIETEVEIRNLAKGRRARVTPGTAEITLRGAEGILAKLDPATLPAYVDLAGLGAGTHRVPVRVQLDGRFALEGITPATVSVRIY